MRTRWTTWLAVSLWMFTLAIVACVLLLMYLNERLVVGLWDEGTAIFALALLSLATVGAILAAHRPKNPIGWIFLVSAISHSINGIAEYGYYRAGAAPGSLPELVLLFWLSEWFWVFGFFLPPTFGILLFPTGRLPSDRWRLFAWIIISFLFFFILTSMFRPGTVDSTGENPDIINPVGVEALGGTFQSALEGFTILIWAILVIGSTVSFFTRLRRATGRERQQMKWFAYAAAIPFTGGAVELMLFNFTSARTGVYITVLGTAFLPVAIGIAILRYNLYDIDRIINRSLVYGSLTVLLLLSFIGSVILFQFLLDPVTGGNDLAVAGSTLLVAALFRPIRNSVQHFVDRRFYRRKYDARQLLLSFSVTARDAVQLDQLTGGLTDIVTRTMQPEHISIWLQPEQETHS